MKVSAAGIQLVKGFEGFCATVYRDSVGVRTIGYGTTEADVRPLPTHLSEPEAAALLGHHLDVKYAPAINGLALPLSQHQFDALLSFIYNVGPGGVAASTGVGRALRAHQWTQAADALLAWDKAGGRVLPGLTRRRQAERALFLRVEDPLEGFTASEKALVREYDRLVRARKNPARRAELVALMAAQRKRIWHAAQGTGGWAAGHRTARYHALLARTT